MTVVPSPAPDECVLEEALARHPISMDLFLPLTVHRLSEGNQNNNFTDFHVILRHIRQAEEEQRILRIYWRGGRSEIVLAVQSKVVTEWAALGIACAVVSVYTDLIMRAVADEGESFDYWLSDGEQDFGLEVSGTITEAIEARHREKVEQLLTNPYGIGGFVVVVGFTTGEIIFSRNAPVRNNQE